MKDINIEQILLSRNNLFLFGEITTKKIDEIVQKILALNYTNDNPILLWINSIGGDIAAAFALIDIINIIGSEVVTIIDGEAASAGGLISIAGNTRCITVNSYWLAHDLSGGIREDYTSKVVARAEYLDRLEKRVFNFIASKTKLSKKELEYAKNKELWLDADECKKKGVVDFIFDKKFLRKGRRKK